MAVIARRSFIALIACSSLWAGDPVQEALRSINHLTTALSDGDAASAMAAFDGSYPDYDKLGGYFSSLVDAYQIANEADVTDQEYSNTEVSLTLDWSLTLTNRTSQAITRRSDEIHARLRREKKNWKIVDFGPIDLFDPQAQSTPPRARLHVRTIRGSSGAIPGGTQRGDS